MPDITYCDASFASVVDNAMRTTGADSDASSLHSFASIVDNAMRTVGADSDTSPAHGFASIVDNLTRTLGADSVTYPVHGFASTVDNAIRTLGADSGTSPAHDFASTLDNAIKSEIALNSGVYGFQSFTLTELVAATNNFSLHNQIGAGNFGSVYRGRLGGCEVAIKRGETSSKKKEFQEILHLYLCIFTRHLRHKNLLGIVGFCCEKDERLLVYEYMKNGSLYDHFHDKGRSVLNSWRMRIKIALDASRGIQYLHNYADPCIIHGDIKSSNILLDTTWMARVSDFGCLTEAAAGTVGYIDPEYYVLNELTEKSDVFGLGVVLLELLTGKRPIFKCGDDGGTPISVVDFAVPTILCGELVKILDPRVGPPDVNEVKAVEIMAYTAIDCVNLKGKDRLTMDNIVVNLEQALAICDNSHGKALAISDNSHDKALTICDNSHAKALAIHDKALTICDNSHDKALAICDNTHGRISSSTISAVLLTKKKKKNFCCFRI